MGADAVCRGIVGDDRETHKVWSALGRADRTWGSVRWAGVGARATWGPLKKRT